MCLSTAYRTDSPDSVICEFVSKIEISGSQIILTDVMGEIRIIEGTLTMADLTGGVIRIQCAAD